MANKWFLSFYIPIAAIIFATIPPAVLICELVVLEEGVSGLSDLGTAAGYEKLQAFADRYTEYFSDALSFEEKEGTVFTQQGCTCKFPFSYSGQSQTNCTSTGPAVMDSKGQPSLWCDTGPFCGKKYHPADRPHTSKPCCYDVCVDKSGDTIRPDSAWHVESRRIARKKTIAKEQKKRAKKGGSSSTKKAAPGFMKKGNPIRTSQGCSCQLPFEFGGEMHHNCTDFGAAVLDPSGRPALWCDTGPTCGTNYHSSDRRFTERTCCYDACLAPSGATLRPGSAWHQESKRNQP